MPGITLTEEEVRKLTSCGNPDAAVLFLYRKAELPRETALAALHFTVPRMVGATDTLRQLGLWQEERPVHPTPERPQYTEEDLKREQQRIVIVAVNFADLQNVLQLIQSGKRRGVALALFGRPELGGIQIDGYISRRIRGIRFPRALPA